MPQRVPSILLTDWSDKHEGLAFRTGMILTLPKNGILHSPERHSLERYSGRRIAEILLHSGEITKDYDVIKIIHRETFAAKVINDHIVVL